MGRNFKFQVQDSFFWNIFFGEIRRFEKRIAVSEKKPQTSLDSYVLFMYYQWFFFSKMFKVIRPQTQTAFCEKDKLHVIALDKFIFL